MGATEEPVFGSESHSGRGEEKSAEDKPQSSSQNVAENSETYITGLKLAAVIVSNALACFLMLLDSSVVGTVCGDSPISFLFFLFA